MIGMQLKHNITDLVFLLQSLNVKQLRRLSTIITEQIKTSELELDKVEKQRNDHLRELGNILHDSVVVEKDEVWF